MVEHIIKFNLPDEEIDLQMHLNGCAYYTIINEILDILRAKLKYNDLTDEQHKIYTDLRTFLWGLIEEAELSHEF